MRRTPAAAGVLTVWFGKVGPGQKGEGHVEMLLSEYLTPTDAANRGPRTAIG